MGIYFSLSKDRLSIDKQNAKTNKTHWTDLYKLYRMRLPYVIRDKLGLDTSFYIIGAVPQLLIQQPIRHYAKEDDLEEIKTMIFTGAAQIDDPIDIYTSHTLLHDAVTLNRPELFKFLVAQGANLNVRDQNGCTPLMKAASIGRMEMC